MAEEHVIEIEKLAVSLTTQWDYGHLGGSRTNNETSRPLLRRINVHIREKNKIDFEPMMLSIGPYNHHLPATHAMQMTKYEYLNYILNLNHDQKSLVDYLDAMKEIEKRVRICYGDELNMDRIDFLKMLLLDGCFVLLTLCGTEASKPELHKYDETSRATDTSKPNNNPKSVINEKLAPDETTLQTGRSCATHEEHQENSRSIDELYSQDLLHDLLLLENQIPFFVLTKIHELMVGGSNARTSELVENIIDMVETALCCYPGSIMKSNQPKEFYHLLHLCHMYFRPCLTEVEVTENHVKSRFHNFLPLGRNVISGYMQSSTTRNIVAGEAPCPWRHATEYHRAGIIFKKRDFCLENPHSLLDIAFCDGVLEIPCLMIDPNTKALFCNLIAFEQTCAQFGCYVTSYAVFLSHLIITPEDVSLLTESGIIMHQFNSEAEVSELFRVISECVVLGSNGDNYLMPVCNRIEAYYQTQRPKISGVLGSMTSTIRRWVRISEYTDLPLTSQEIPI